MSESRWRRLVRVRRTSVEREVDDEMAFHVQMRIEQFMAEGRSRADAEHAALAQFGDVGDVRTRLVGIDRSTRRRTHWRDAIGNLSHDIVVALRGLRRSPLFAAGVMATLAIGIGANATMFAVVDRLMLSGPAHVADARQVQRVYTAGGSAWRGSGPNVLWSYQDYIALRDQTRLFSGVGAYTSARVRLGAGYDARLVPAVSASASFFSTLGVRPALGRFFDASEDGAVAGNPIVVIGYEFWHSELGADPEVIGTSVTLSGRAYRVIGVAPRGFVGLESSRVDAWLPLNHPAWAMNGNIQWLRVIARLRPGVDAERASADGSRVIGALPDPSAVLRHENAPPRRAVVRPLWYTDAGTPSVNAQVSLWLAGVAGTMLLIVCANVANLLLARTLRRRHELAVRVALGIGRARMLRLLLTETVMLAAGGALLGLVLTAMGAGLVRTTLLADAPTTGALVDMRMLIVTAGLVVVTTLFVGLLPAMHASRITVTAGIKSGARDGGGRRGMARASLVAIQAAVSVVLLSGAALFVVSLTRLQQVDLGFQPERVLRVYPTLAPTAGLSDSAQTARNDARTAAIADRLRSAPSVERVSLASGGPFGNAFSPQLFVPGYDSLPSFADGGPYLNAVDADYFAVLGTPLRRGRLFTPQDRAGSEPVAIVSETMARTLWPADDALGRCLHVRQRTAPCARIVGVVGDVHRRRVRESAAMQYYLPIGQASIDGPGILVRARSGFDTARVARDLHGLLRGLPDVRRVSVHPLIEFVMPEFRPWQLGARMFELFGVIALVVAAIGLYCVMGYLVAERTREIGVRIALGADAGRVARQVVAGGLRITLVGVIGGMIVVPIAGRALDPLLFGVSSRNPYVLSGIALTLLVVAAIATVLPAIRAARIDPADSLRME